MKRTVSVLWVLGLLILVGCSHRERAVYTYQNALYSFEYPADWPEVEVVADKVLLSDEKGTFTLRVEAAVYETPVEDMLAEMPYERQVVDDIEGIGLREHSGEKYRELYFIQTHGMLFQLRFEYLDERSGETVAQLLKSFQFNALEEAAYSQWRVYRSGVLEVHYPAGSSVSSRVAAWTEKRLTAFEAATSFLGIHWTGEPIEMYVFDTAEHGLAYGIQLGFARPEMRQVYTAHNQSKGHELAHVAAHQINPSGTIDAPVIREGLATLLDGSGRDYHALAKAHLSVREDVTLLGADFWNEPEGYVLGASFVQYLIDVYGLEAFKGFYGQRELNEAESFKTYYGIEAERMLRQWRTYLTDWR